MHILGIDWVGVNADNGRKLLLSVIFVAVLLIREEMAIPITYAADSVRVEAILLEAARLHATEANAMAARPPMVARKVFIPIG